MVIEKGSDKYTYGSDEWPSSSGQVEQSQPREPILRRFIDSFKPAVIEGVDDQPSGSFGVGKYDKQSAAQGTVNTGLQRHLKGRHLQMIAIGGSIGTGLFVSSGATLGTGGPASLLIAFLLMGFMLLCTVYALAELAVLYPVSGGFSAYATRFLDPAWGFAMAWNYAIQWLVILPLEIVAASITIQYWTQGSINNAVFVSIFLVAIIVINLFGVRGYGEAEFVLSIIKVIAVVGYIILGIILDCGGGPHGSYIGGKYWYNPGAFHNGFKGFCSSLVTAAFAFGGTELVGLAAAETANPRREVPRASKSVFWRISLFYIVSLTLVGLLVPYTDKNLLDATSSVDIAASPFVISIVRAGIPVLPSIFNAVILVSVLSVGNSSIFGSSRTLAALAHQRQAPKILGYVDRQGRPIFAIILASALGFLAYLADSDQEQTAFNWMLALSGLSSIITWGSINLCHIRLRAGWARQGRTLDELPYRSPLGIWGSWCGFIFNCLVVIAQFWTGAWPVDYGMLGATGQVESFFQAYLAVPITLVCYIVWKVVFKTPIMRASEMDLDTGRRELNVADLIAEERAERATWPMWKKVYRIFC